MVRAKFRDFLGNAPLKLVAVLLFAILIPSVLVTALGLVAVFQADGFVQQFRRSEIESRLAELEQRLEGSWSARLALYGKHLHNADDRAQYLVDLRRRDPYIREILLGDARGLRPVAEAPPANLWLDGTTEALSLLRRLEARPEGEVTALAEARRILRESRQDAVLVEALLAAARLSHRLGEPRRSVEYLEQTLTDYGHTRDVTGVVRALPILWRLAELSTELEDRAGREAYMRRLRRAFVRYERYMGPDSRRVFRARAGTVEDDSDRWPASRDALRFTEAELAAWRQVLPRRLESMPSTASRLRLGEEQVDVFSFPTKVSTTVVHVVLDRGAFCDEAQWYGAELDLPVSGIVFAKEERRAVGRNVARTEDRFMRNAPAPFDHLELRYVPAPGQLPPRLRGFEVMSLATFTWAVVVLVLSIIVGVIFTLRSVLRERRTARLKTDFVSFISHELKTPLTAIRLYAETLLEGRAVDDDEKEFCMRMVDRESERLSHLIDQILQYSQFEKEQKEFLFSTCDMEEVVRDAVGLYREHSQDDRRQIEINAVQRISKIKMDRAAMIELFLNFLTNAAKYSAADDGIVINLRESIDDISVDVVDRGVGIRKREQKKIFEKFYRADDYLTREIEGTGLGLTFARYIAKVHNGEIRVASQLNGGSTFTLQLRKTHVLAE